MFADRDIECLQTVRIVSSKTVVIITLTRYIKP